MRRRTTTAVLPMLTLLAAGTLAAGGAAAQGLTIALSTQEIGITSNFTGGDVTLFGVIERGDDGPQTAYDVVVTLVGPAQNTVVRRKDRVLGIWINRASETVLAAPGYYGVRTSAPLAEIAEPETLGRRSLGIDNIGLVYRGRIVVNDPAAEEFRQAFLRLKTGGGLYTEAADVDFIGDSIFRTTVSLPASIPVGRYTATAYLFADGEEVLSEREFMRVSRVGGERFMFDFARNQSLLYGIVAVVLALFVGWLGGVMFRRD